MNTKNKNLFSWLILLTLAVLVLGLVATISYSAGREAESKDRIDTELAAESSDFVIESDQGLPPTSTIETTSTPEAIATSPDESEEGQAPIAADQSEDAPVEIAPSPTLPPLPTIAPTATPSQRTPVGLGNEEIELLIEVWQFLDDEFDGPLPTSSSVLYSAINGSLELLNDDFTRFIPPEVAARNRESLQGSYEGIGAFVDMTEDGQLLIVRPLEGQPADLAGLKAGDIVTHVEGESIQGLSMDEIINRVKGPSGTAVSLTIRRDETSTTFEVSIIRELIEFQIVESRMLEDEIAYLRLASFSGNATEQLSGALDRLLDESPGALIFDLRDNPGGFLNQAVSVADLFLDRGVVLYQRNRDGVEEIFESRNGDPGEAIQLVILVNEGSASASEIVAGAIKDRARGTIIGQTTFGKGSVQQSHTLSDGSELRVTIARWYTPANSSIDQVGIAPDIEVETPEEFGSENDTQLMGAIEFLTNSP